MISVLIFLVCLHDLMTVINCQTGLLFGISAGNTYNRSPIKSIQTSSISECCLTCLETDMCIAMNVRCAGGGDQTCAGGGKWTCDLMSDAAFVTIDLGTLQGAHYIGPEFQQIILSPVSDPNYRHYVYSHVDITNKKHMKFFLKSCRDAFLALSSGPLATGDAYEVVLGGWTNSKSVIRPGVQKPVMDSQIISTPNILDCTQYRRFWLTWGHDARVQLGKGWQLQENIILDFSFPVSHEVNFLSTSGFRGVDAYFIFTDL